MLNGRYQLLRLLAEGGMATIHLARDERTGREVVVKKARKDVSRNLVLRRMFLDEMRIASLMVHPNIPCVIDAGRGIPDFYVMEYLEGLDVLKLINHEIESDREMPLEHALTIAIGIAEPLAAAHGHESHVVHRDVSPSNVHVGTDGRVCLLDFGVARAEIDDRAQTGIGMLKGKLSYMSPEQLCGKVVDWRTDIYSLGIVLYEMTLGWQLFPGQGKSLVEQRERRITRPTELVSSYPKDLEAIVLRALAPDPELRFQSATDLARALRCFADSHGILLSPMGLGRYVTEVMADDTPEADDSGEYAEFSIIENAELSLDAEPSNVEDAPTLQFVRGVAPISAGAVRRRSNACYASWSRTE